MCDKELLRTPDISEPGLALSDLGPYLEGQIRFASNPGLNPAWVYSDNEITNQWQAILHQEGDFAEKLRLMEGCDVRRTESRLIVVRSVELAARVAVYRLDKRDTLARDLVVSPSGEIGQRIVRQVCKHLAHVAAEIDPTKQIRGRVTPASVGSLVLVAKFDGIGVHAVGRPEEGIILHVAPSQQ